MTEKKMSLLIDPRIMNAIYRSDFVSFFRKCFATLSGTPLMMNWHIYALAHALEQVRRGKIRRLIINIPPRSLKSTMTSVALPAFALGHDPSKNIIVVSYASDLAVKLANDCRLILNAPWYHELFPEMEISPYKNTEFEIATTRNGFRLATSIEGGVTGRGANILIIDDPLKPIDALSDPKRERVNDTFNHTLRSRLNDQKTGAIIVVMQRLHPNDLTGSLLRDSPDEWIVLSLPAIASQEQIIRIGDGKDDFHVRRGGQPLHAEREPQDVLDSLRAQLPPHIFAAQYQQAPVPVNGLMIERQWIQRYDRPPERGPGSFLFQSVDTAIKDGAQNDYSVCTTWLYQDKKYYLIHVLRGRFNVPKLQELAISHARAYNPKMVLVEDAGIGAALINELKKAGQSVVAVKPVHDKRTRMSMQTPKFASGQVFFPTAAPWLAELEAELFAFPNSLHDDQVDSISQALAHEISEYGWSDESLAGFARFNEMFAFMHRFGEW
jgi:predicted phage terminase large subunit-like protein